MNKKQFNSTDNTFFRKSNMAGKSDKSVDMNEPTDLQPLLQSTNDNKGRDSTTKGSYISGNVGGVTQLALRLFICLLCGIVFGICFTKGRGKITCSEISF